MGVFLALCGVCACALMQVLLLPIGRGFTGQCLDIGDLAAAIGGRVPDAVVTFEPVQEALGRGRSKVRPCLLMRHCTAVRSRGLYGWTEADDGLKRMWLR